MIGRLVVSTELIKQLLALPINARIVGVQDFKLHPGRMANDERGEVTLLIDGADAEGEIEATSYLHTCEADGVEKQWQRTELRTPAYRIAR